MFRSLGNTGLREIVPKLLGVIQNVGTLPTLVFDGDLMPARLKYCCQASQAETVADGHHFKDCHVLIDSLSGALSWLHKKGLVHIELSLDSVLVSVYTTNCSVRQVTK